MLDVHTKLFRRKVADVSAGRKDAIVTPEKTAQCFSFGRRLYDNQLHRC